MNLLADDSAELELEQKLKIVNKLKTMPIAIATDEANEQHYEVPAKFYDLCLGPRKKYSSGFWPNPDTTFEESEVAMLEKYCEYAGVKDGMSIVGTYEISKDAKTIRTGCCTLFHWNAD